jgi:ACGX-repeat protein
MLAESILEVMIMALSNLNAWKKDEETAPAAACGTACGASDKPTEAPAACGAAAPEEKPAACGAACGAGDKQ